MYSIAVLPSSVTIISAKLILVVSIVINNSIYIWTIPTKKVPTVHVISLLKSFRGCNRKEMCDFFISLFFRNVENRETMQILLNSNPGIHYFKYLFNREHRRDSYYCLAVVCIQSCFPNTRLAFSNIQVIFFKLYKNYLKNLVNVVNTRMLPQKPDT